MENKNEILKELKKQINKEIPIVEKIDDNTFGIKYINDEIVGLGLYNQHLKSFPNLIMNIKSLQELNLRGNHISKLPNLIDQMQSLQKLILSYNEISKLPESIGNLKSLKILDLYVNKITWLPDSIGNLQELQKLHLGGNQLINLPESIGELDSLQELYLFGNKLMTLPNSFGNLKSLKVLFLNKNELTILPQTFGNLKSLQELILFSNQLNTLPISFKQLDSLQKLNLNNNKFLEFPEVLFELQTLEELNYSGNKLRILPMSFGRLQHIKKLNLSENELDSLPRSILNQKTLQELDLRNNGLTRLPNSIWRLKSLKLIRLEGNPWEREFQEIVTRDVQTILDFHRKRDTIQIFISHAVVDFDHFKIEEISKYLAQQEEIYKVFYCEEDLKGNIDDFMYEFLPQSQLILFFASKKSVFDSNDCALELELARQNHIEIIPIKGRAIGWDDLEEKNLSREFGFEFDDDDFNGFCTKLYEYIKDFKRAINLFDPNEAILDREKLKIKTSTVNFIESAEFKEGLKKNYIQLNKLFQKLSEKQITPLNYISNWVQILSEQERQNDS